MSTPSQVSGSGAGRSASEGRRRRRPYRPRGSRFLGLFFVVLIVGIALSIFNLSVGVGVSVRVPFTTSNVTVAGSLGAKAKTKEALPNYTQGRVAGNQNLFNYTETMTVGPAQGAGLIVIGHQGQAPVVDLHLAAR